MASPIGHGLVGVAIGRFGERPSGPEGPLLLAVCAAFAIAPDLDFLPGIAVGQPALYHQGASHSLLAALAASGIAARLLWRGNAGWHRAWALLLAAYGSHLLLDGLGPDGRPPIGMPLFWPVSDATFLSPWTLLPGIDHAAQTSTGVGEWLGNVLSWRNVWALTIELALATPLLLLAELRRRRSGARA